MLTADRTTPAHLFGPGNKAAKGRRPGSRNLLADRFFKDLYGLWEEQGEAVIRRTAFEKPEVLLAIVAKLMPAKLEISTPTDGMTDEQLLRMIELAERMAAIGAGNAKASMTIEGRAVEVRGGGGSPQANVKGGEVVEVIPSSPPILEPLLTEQAPSAAAAPTGDPPLSIAAHVPVSLDAPAMDDEVDPLSLF